MTGEVRLRPEAEQDLVEAATWYEGNQPGLGQQFLDEVEVTLTAIGDQPLVYTAVYRSLRRALLKRLPVWSVLSCGRPQRCGHCDTARQSTSALMEEPPLTPAAESTGHAPISNRNGRPPLAYY